MILSATDVTGIHDKLVALWHEDKAASIQELIEDTAKHTILRIVAEQHRANYDLWHQEDQARRQDVADSVIAAVKRAIDALNQTRNNLIETIDEAILNALAAEGVTPAVGAIRYSETPGAMVDRLSILSLKIYHMREQRDRRDVPDAHRVACDGKLAVLLEQRDDLAESLASVMAEIESGHAYLKIYRQFKMYNDPNLNPAVYGAER